MIIFYADRANINAFLFLENRVSFPQSQTIIICTDKLNSVLIINKTVQVVDVFAENASIRREQANLVDNKQQYLLAHLALVECLFSIPTTLPCKKTLPTRIKELKKQLPVQQQRYVSLSTHSRNWVLACSLAITKGSIIFRLQNTAWQDEALRPVTFPLSLSERNRRKNRFPELISGLSGSIQIVHRKKSFVVAT